MNSKEMMIDLHQKGKKANYIKAVVQDEFDLTHKATEALYKECAVEQGWSIGGDNQNLVTLVEVLRANHGKIPRKELVALMAEESGYTPSTANHMLSQLAFAQEYAKQEAAAQKAEQEAAEQEAAE